MTFTYNITLHASCLICYMTILTIRVRDGKVSDMVSYTTLLYVMVITPYLKCGHTGQ